MLKFKEYITEGGYNVPVVTINKEKVDLSRRDTRNEINRNLSAELAKEFINPYGGWERLRKILIMYGIALPNILFQDAEEGEEVVAINQFGDRWGAEVNGIVTSPGTPEEEEYYLYYSYGIGEHGFYDSFAVITDANGLEDFIKDDLEDDVDFETPEGDLDPRQP